MYKNKRVAVVIPAYNVAEQILGVLRSLPACVDHAVVVEDASRDGTWSRLEQQAPPRATLLRHSANQGVGAAMVTGFRKALELGADLIVKMDGDGQMDPAYLPALLEPVAAGECDYAKGNRFLCAERLDTMPRLRLAGNFALTFLSKLASGYWQIFDPVNGYVAIDAAMLRRLPLERIARRYFFEIDMLIQLNIQRARVKDVAIPARYGDETSSLSLWRVLLSFPFHLLRGFWQRLYERHVLREFSPVAVFWILGALLLAWGGGFGAYTWGKSLWTNRAATTGTVMLSVLPFILGFQLVLQAILIEIQESKQ